jgi:hypothetical protein
MVGFAHSNHDLGGHTRIRLTTLRLTTLLDCHPNEISPFALLSLPHMLSIQRALLHSPTATMYRTPLWSGFLL